MKNIGHYLVVLAVVFLSHVSQVFLSHVRFYSANCFSVASVMRQSMSTNFLLLVMKVGSGANKIG